MEPNTSLSKQLAAYKAGFVQRAAPERVAMMEAATAGLRATGIESQALQVGAQVPDLTLPDASRQPVSLSSLWRTGTTTNPRMLIYSNGKMAINIFKLFQKK